jgi:hypothetical protein
MINHPRTQMNKTERHSFSSSLLLLFPFLSSIFWFCRSAASSPLGAHGKFGFRLQCHMQCPPSHQFSSYRTCVVLQSYGVSYYCRAFGYIVLSFRISLDSSSLERLRNIIRENSIALLDQKSTNISYLQYCIVRLFGYQEIGTVKRY